MSLCQYCETVEIAWKQVERKYVAFHAARDAAGQPVKMEVRDGTRTVRRTVADESKRHYPHAHHGPAAGSRTASECAVWTPEKAAARPAKKGWRGRRSAVSAAPSAPSAAPSTGIGTAAAIPTATIGGPAAPAVKTKPGRLPEPETMMAAPDLAAWVRAEAAIRCAILPTRVLLYGPPGTGKTELPYRIAQSEGWAHVYQLMTEETPGTELLGHLIVQAGSTVWCDGTLGRAIRASQAGPVVYVVDEIARASADAMSACLCALTNPESLRLTLRSGEVIAPDPANWHVVATSNDDPKMLPPALADRLHIAVMLSAPHPDLVRSMTTIEARRLATARSREYSVRALLTFDRLVAGGMTIADAAAMVWEPAVCSAFLDAARLEGRR